MCVRDSLTKKDVAWLATGPFRRKEAPASERVRAYARCVAALIARWLRATRLRRKRAGKEAPVRGLSLSSSPFELRSVSIGTWLKSMSSDEFEAEICVRSNLMNLHQIKEASNASSKIVKFKRQI